MTQPQLPSSSSSWTRNSHATKAAAAAAASNTTQWKSFLCVCLLLWISHLPVSSARYFRPTSARGFGGVSMAARQKNNEDDEKEQVAAAAIAGDNNEEEEVVADDQIDDNEEEEQDDDDDDEPQEEEDDAIAPEQADGEDTSFPADFELSPTESPTWFPTFDGEFANATSFAPTTPPSLEPSATPEAAKDDKDVATESPSFSPTPSPTADDTTTPDEETPTDDLVPATTNVTVTSTNNMTDDDTTDDEMNTDDTVLDTAPFEDSIYDTMTEIPVTATTTPEPTTVAPTEPPPTMAPTKGVRLDARVVTGQLTLHLAGISEAFYDDDRMLFLAAAQEFIAIESSARGGLVDDIRVIVVYQRLVDVDSTNASSNDRNGGRLLRQLQDDDNVLQVDLGVDGLASDGSTLSVDDWNQWLRDLFQDRGLQFVTTIQDMGTGEGNSFFEPLESVAALEPPRAVVPTMAPTRVVPALIVTDDGGADEDGVPLLAIVGAAVGGVIFLIAGVLLVRLGLRYQKEKGVPLGDNQSTAHSITNGPSNSMDVSVNDNVATKNSRAAGADGNINTKPSAGESSVSSGSYLYTNSAMHSQNYGRQLVESDTQSQMGGTTTGDMSVMSYAYSLEPGIEPSLAGIPQNVVPSSSASAMSFAYPGAASVASGASSFAAFLKNPLASKSSGGISPSSLSGKPTTDVIAPAGKLGIVIDTTIEGPVVHKVNPGSALEGKLNSGDIIVAIDDVDTRAMTAAAITALMVKTANQRRKLTIISSQ